MWTESAQSCDRQAAAIEHLDFQVDTFGQAVTMPTIEVVQNAFAPPVDVLQTLAGTAFGGFALVCLPTSFCQRLAIRRLCNQVRKSSFKS